MLRTRQCLILSFAAVFIFFMTACSSQEKEAEPAVNVQVATVKTEAIERVISTDAVLYPVQQASITPKIAAPVKRFYVNRGSAVKKGQLLATLENQDLQASEIENKGGLTQAEASYANTTSAGVPEELQKAELDAESAKQGLDAEQKLYNSREDLYKQGALPRKDLDQARVSLTQSRSQYDIAKKHLASLQSGGKEQELKSAEGQLQAARGKYLGAQAQLNYSEIRSPIDGVVVERPLFPGETAATGTPLFVVMNVTQVIAKAHIPAADAAFLKAGDAAELSSAGINEKTSAKITLVSPATDPNSTTVEIWAIANNPGGHLRPGMTVQLSIVAQTIDDALVVSPSAVLNQPDGSKGVMVVESDGRAHLRVVHLGIQSTTEDEVISGISKGDQVITAGSFGLPDGTPVKIDQAKTPTKAGDD